MAALLSGGVENTISDFYGQNIALMTILDAMLKDEMNATTFEFYRLQTLLNAHHERQNTETILAIDRTFSLYKKHFIK